MLLTKLDQSWSLYKDEFSLYEYIGDEYDVLPSLPCRRIRPPYRLSLWFCGLGTSVNTSVPCSHLPLHPLHLLVLLPCPSMFHGTIQTVLSSHEDQARRTALVGPHHVALHLVHARWPAFAVPVQEALNPAPPVVAPASPRKCFAPVCHAMALCVPSRHRVSSSTPTAQGETPLQKMPSQ